MDSADKTRDSALSKEQIEEIILKLLVVDPKPIPFNVLKSKFFRYIRHYHPEEFLSEELFFNILSSLKQRYILGENQYGKWFIDYLDYEPSGRFGVGYLEINEGSGNGFITVREKDEKYKKSSHFVHKKNLNGAKSGSYVKFEELEPKLKKRRVSNFSLIDATIVEVLEPKLNSEA